MALVGDDAGDRSRAWCAARFRPHIVLAGGDPAGVPLLAGREPVDGRAAAYVCENFACKLPGDRAGGARGAAGLIAAAQLAAALLAGAAPGPGAAEAAAYKPDALRAATRIARGGPGRRARVPSCALTRSLPAASAAPASA